MTYGLRTVNDDGVVQIDEEFRNLVVIESGSGSASPSFGLNNQSITSQSSCVPLVFVKPASGVEVGTFSMNAGWNGASYDPGPPYTNFAYQSTGAFDYKVCALDSQPSPSGSHGMRVFNSGATNVYDSRLPYAQIKSMARLSAQSSPGYIDVTVPDIGSTPWFLLNYLVFNQQFGDFGPFRGFAAKALSNTSIRVRCYDTDISSGNYAGSPNFDVFMPPLILMTAKF